MERERETNDARMAWKAAQINGVLVGDGLGGGAEKVFPERTAVTSTPGPHGFRRITEIPQRGALSQANLYRNYRCKGSLVSISVTGAATGLQRN